MFLNMHALCSSGQNLVPEPQDEAEARGAGDARGLSAASDGSATRAPGSVPLLRQTATSVSSSRPSDASDPVATAHDATSSSSSPHDAEATLLLKTRLKTLSFETLKSHSVCNICTVCKKL